MFFNPRTALDDRRLATAGHGHEHGELPVDDPAPKERPSESYASWRPTAIFSLSPFAAPPGG